MSQGLDTGILARSPIVIARTRAIVVSVQSLEGRAVAFLELKIFKLNADRALITNAAKADIWKIKVNAIIGKEIVANPTTNAIGNHALIVVNRLVLKVNSPAFVKTSANHCRKQNEFNGHFAVTKPHHESE